MARPTDRNAAMGRINGMSVFRVRLTLFTSLAIVAAGCSSTQIKKSWVNPEFTGQALGKVMVIAVNSDEVRRADFESQMATELERQAVDATPRSNIAGLHEKPGREQVEQVVKADGYDHVLVTRLTAITEDEVRHAGYTEYEVYGTRGRFGRYWVTGVEEVEHPAYTEVTTHLYVETSLFETTGGQVVWRLRTETTNPQFVDLSSELVSAVSRQLRKDGLIGNSR